MFYCFYLETLFRIYFNHQIPSTLVWKRNLLSWRHLKKKKIEPWLKTSAQVSHVASFFQAAFGFLGKSFRIRCKKLILQAKVWKLHLTLYFSLCFGIHTLVFMPHVILCHFCLFEYRNWNGFDSKYVFFSGIYLRGLLILDIVPLSEILARLAALCRSFLSV